MKYKNFENLSIFNIDALKYSFEKLQGYKIISNLPYNISTKILSKTMILNSNFNEIICMIQKELAEKFNYEQGKMNKYKFVTQYCGSYEIKFNVYLESPKKLYLPRFYGIQTFGFILLMTLFIFVFYNDIRNLLIN